ncbi:hypothetical protein HHE03_18280 [Helicobacter heilmannii]|nr:hypothetical protein HHE03_18280 [Helicobacter heilmannii]
MAFKIFMHGFKQNYKIKTRVKKFKRFFGTIALALAHRLKAAQA